MCEDCGIGTTRRALLRTVPLALSAPLWLPSHRASASGVAAPEIRPRTEWAGSLPVVGTLVAETPKFLLIHHTYQPDNQYTPGEVTDRIRQLYRYHRSSPRNWPDLAYNFVVDQFGGIWEGRHGSLDGPVRGSATGGNQGYSQLCCFLGDLVSTPPTPAAQAAMTHLLAWLADRYSISTAPGASIEFDSLGSNRWAKGKHVIADTICGHREMSNTECPGDAGFQVVKHVLPDAVAAFRGTPLPSSTTTTSPPTTTTTAPATTSTTAMAATMPTGSAPTTTGSSRIPRPDPTDLHNNPPTPAERSATPWIVSGTGVGLAALGGWAISRRNTRRRSEVPPLSDELNQH